jgi:hypothetical protein
MADIQTVKTASALIYTGEGFLTGLVVSLSSGTSGTMICYDNTAGSGTKIFEAEVYSLHDPLIIFFADRYAPRFATGLYIALDSNMSANVWAVGK